jgi:hypothetical protein
LQILNTREWAGIVCLRIGFSGCSFEHGNQSFSSIKGGEFLEQQNDYYFRKDSAPFSYIDF